MSNKSDISVRLLQGNESCAEAALLAGVRFFAGYPITPSTEIAEILSERLPQEGGKFIQMEDEIGSMAAIIGASLAGLKSMTATSGPGFSLKQENIGFAAFTEVPCVIVDVQRTGPSTGLPTSPAQGDLMQARWGTHGDHPAVALYPSSVSEVFDLTIQAVNISERLRTPVILLLDEVVAHMREKVVIPPESEIEIHHRPRPTVPPEDYLPYAAEPDGVPPMADFGTGYRYHVTGLYHDVTGYPTSSPQAVDFLIRRLHAKVAAAQSEITFTREEFVDDADTCVVACGVTARSARRAVQLAREKGLRCGLLQPMTIWPFPSGKVAAIASAVKRVIVPEMNMGQLLGEVERAAGNRCEVVGYSKVDGEPITPAEILSRIEEV
ncbi:MAG: 2-oxoacid:acceptor oxidoreductase subunit alpha [Firmicutes bacterium]|jgi:2-oxoglutarate ferredoxin oxidoreductase subunit alpha|nr:2-oxoacid:acceptor oxidoreductase subunit alpha [Bacillota bacterium]